jgi:hypothetical protein
VGARERTGREGEREREREEERKRGRERERGIERERERGDRRERERERHNPSHKSGASLSLFHRGLALRAALAF